MEKEKVNKTEDSIIHGKYNKFEKKVFSPSNTLALKGIAIIMLIFFHCFSSEGRLLGYNISFFPFNKEFIFKLTNIFNICVSIFVFITGYGLTLSLKKLNEKYNWTNKEIFKWTINRLIKLLSGFWIIVILSLIICQAIDGRTGNVLFKQGVIYGIAKVIVNFFGLANIMSITNFCSTWWYMSSAILYVISLPIYAKLSKKYGYFPILVAAFAIPRIIGWEFSNANYITFLFPLLLGMIFAENNLMVKIANFKINKNVYINKIIKFIIETIIIIVLCLVYNEVPLKIFFELRYGIIPLFVMCYLYEFFIEIPILKQILQFLGKHSMNIFLIHTFLRVDYLSDYIYSFKNFLKVGFVLIVISLIISIILELFKKLIRYDKLINKLQIKDD